MLQNGSNDLYTPFLALESARESMACAPGRAIKAIAGLHPLYLMILRLCRDGVLPRERMQTALRNLDNHMGIFRQRFLLKGRIPDGRPTVEVAQDICDIIQYGANILRDLKKSTIPYHRFMRGPYWKKDGPRNLIDELIDTITFDNSPETEAMDVAHQHSNVDDTGCRMDVFDRVLSGALGRPLQPDINVRPWMDWPWKDPALGTQTPAGDAGDAGSVGTDEAVELEPAVDTPHHYGPLIWQPKKRQPRRNGKWISGKASCTTTAVEQLPVSSGLRQDGSPPKTSDIKSPVPGVASSGYRKLVDRIMKYRAMECDVGRDIESQRRKYCEAAYKARLTRRMPSGGGTVVEQLAGHRKAARKSFVKAGREFDRVVSGI